MRPSVEANAGWMITSLLLAGMLAWGGIGWIVDQVLDTEFLLPTGLIIGAASSLYLVMKRFGQSDERPPRTDGKTE